MNTGTSMAHKRPRRGYWGLAGRWCCQRLCNMSVAFSADKGLAERFLLLKSTLFVGGLQRMSVCVLCVFFFLSSQRNGELSLRSFSPQKSRTHASPKNPTSFHPLSRLSPRSLFASAYCIIAPTSDFWRHGLSIREKWQIHMFGGKKKGVFIFRERQDAEVFQV